MGASGLRLTPRDVERLLALRASRHASAYRCEIEAGELLVTAQGIRVPGLGDLGLDVTIAVRASLAPDQPNGADVTLRVHRSAIGPGVFAVPFLGRIVEGWLGAKARGFVRETSPGRWRADLSGLTLGGRPLSETLTLSSLEVPAADGEAALAAEFQIRGD